MVVHSNKELSYSYYYDYDCVVLANRVFRILVMCGIGEFWYRSVLVCTSASFCLCLDDLVFTLLVGRGENHRLNLLCFYDLAANCFVIFFSRSVGLTVLELRSACSKLT